MDLKISGESDLGKAILKFEASGQHVDEILEDVGELLVSAVSDVFEAEGPGWLPLDPKTLKRRRKGGKGAKILQDTGIMAGSVDKRIGSTYVEAVIGTSYAIYHVEGRGVPQRNPLDLGPFEAGLFDDVAEILMLHITK